MAKFTFPGVGQFLPGDDDEARRTGQRNDQLSKLGTILGHCGGHDDPEAQEGTLEAARRQRELLASHLAAADAALAWAEKAAGLARAPKKGK